MLEHANLTQEILNAFYEVYRELGYGFLEKVYQNALVIELKERGLTVASQKRCVVHYKGKEVGEYYADIIVNDLVVLELKASETIMAQHKFQLLNYLKASSLELGFVLNFGKKPEFSRKIFTNKYKKGPEKDS
ncbi:MAG: GxxExxY protein [Saprospiraceae bacterium]